MSKFNEVRLSDGRVLEGYQTVVLHRRFRGRKKDARELARVLRESLKDLTDHERASLEEMYE